MLKVPSPFPQVGSFALLIDDTLPIAEQRAELVRVMRHSPPSVGEDGAGQQTSVAFPLRTGASGNRIVATTVLLDPTALTKAEEHELTNLQRYLEGRDRLTPKMKLATVRADALRQRQMNATLLAIELRKLEAVDAREVRRAGGSLGARLSWAA